MITIGLRDVYAQLQNVSQLTNSLGGKIDAAVAAQTFNAQSSQAAFTNIHAELTDHEHRIRNLEARTSVSPKSMWTGAAVIISAIGLFMVIIQLVMK